MAKRKLIYNATELIASLDYDTSVADNNGQDIIERLTTAITELDNRVKAIIPSMSKNDIINALQDAKDVVKSLLESLNTDVNNKVNITYTLQDTFIGTAVQAKKWFDAEGIDYSEWDDQLENKKANP